ncbi:MAG: 50S ribosomal protein L30e [Thermoplasmatota archaeon]
MVDDEKVFKNMVKKGSVVFGSRQTRLTVDKNDAKLVVIASNCPEDDEITTIAEEKNIPVYHAAANNVDLGSHCGKAYAVSVFAVIDDGGVNISSLLKKR